MMEKSPALFVTRQTSISEDKIMTKGKTFTVYVVVKNSPFQLAVSLKNCEVSLKHLSFDILLIYDMPDYNKEVAYVSTKPVDYKTAINEKGDEIVFDAKISALSSQHEDSFFRLKINVWDPNSPHLQLSALSHPVKVISKPVNQRKPRAKKTASTPVLRKQPSKSKLSQGSSSPDDSSPVSDCILDATSHSHELLTRIDAQQQETVSLLHQLIATSSKRPRTVFEESAPHNPYPPPQYPNQHIKNYPLDAYRPLPGAPPFRPSPSPASDFESSFSAMVRSFSLLSTEEKQTSIFKILSTMSAYETDQIEELIDTCGAHCRKPHNLPAEYSFYSEPGPNCDVQFRPESLPYDHFYENMF
uniref:Uncharacterized protein n=1 Tax=Arcella intermedia TaxID=1963864 RepID=A0A6B2L782_9EUKA